MPAKVDLRAELAVGRRMAAVLLTWLDDRSSIVKTSALHATAQLARQDPTLLPDALDLLRIAGRSGTPAMRARSRILLKELEKPRKPGHGSPSPRQFA